MSVDPRYPVGKLEYAGFADDSTRAKRIAIVAETPAKFRAAISGLTEAQLDTPYREGGWTVRQLAHHVADSHMNAFIRFKLGLTEDTPPVKAYDEKAWANLADTKMTPVEASLNILENMHVRWVHLLKSMSTKDFERKVMHSENGEMTLDKVLNVYAWHGPHHTAHVTELRKAKGW